MIFTSLWLSKQAGQMCSIEKSWALGRVSSRAGQSALTAQLSGLFVNGSSEPWLHWDVSLLINRHITHPHLPTTPHFIHFPPVSLLYYRYFLMFLQHYVVVSSFRGSFTKKHASLLLKEHNMAGPFLQHLIENIFDPAALWCTETRGCVLLLLNIITTIQS